MPQPPLPAIVRASRRAVAALAFMGLAVFALACGESEKLSASSQCRDYLEANIDEKSAGVARAAEERNVAGASSTLGTANVDYICSNDPDSTLGDAVAGSGSQQSTAPAGETTTAEPPTGPAAISFGNRGYTGTIAFLGLEYSPEGIPPPLTAAEGTFRVTNTTDRTAPITGNLLPTLALEMELPATAFRDDACPEDEGRRNGYCLMDMTLGYTGTSQLGAGEQLDIPFRGDQNLDEEPDVTDVRFYFDGKRVPTK